MKLKQIADSPESPVGVKLHDVSDPSLEGKFKQLGIKVGMMLETVAGEDVTSLSYNELIAKLKAVGRPLTITFRKVDGGSAAAPAPVVACLLYTSPSPRDS